MSEHYIYQYWVVSEDDYSHVCDGPFNSEREAWLTLDNSPYRNVVKTKHRVLETSEDLNHDRKETAKMSLDVYLTAIRPTTVHSTNITHNLGKMAAEAGIYDCIWYPDTMGISKAEQLIEPLERGLAELKARPDHYKQFDAANGWGVYSDFIWFVEDYLKACKENPDAAVEALR